MVAIKTELSESFGEAAPLYIQRVMERSSMIDDSLFSIFLWTTLKVSCRRPVTDPAFLISLVRLCHWPKRCSPSRPQRRTERWPQLSGRASPTSCCTHWRTSAFSGSGIKSGLPCVQPLAVCPPVQLPVFLSPLHISTNAVPFFLKSITISLFLSTFSSRWSTLAHSTRPSTGALHSSSPSLVHPATAESSENSWRRTDSEFYWKSVMWWWKIHQNTVQMDQRWPACQVVSDPGHSSASQSSPLHWSWNKRPIRCNLKHSLT